MSDTHPARVTLRGYGSTPARIHAEPVPQSRRAVRALLTLGLFWLLVPLVALIPPHAPWALLAFAAGIILAARQWRGEYVVQEFEGRCPSCGEALTLEPGTRIRGAHPVTCYHCHQEGEVRLEPAGAPGSAGER